jgi:hypothetical protein
MPPIIVKVSFNCYFKMIEEKVYIKSLETVPFFMNEVVVNKCTSTFTTEIIYLNIMNIF